MLRQRKVPMHHRDVVLFRRLLLEGSRTRTVGTFHIFKDHQGNACALGRAQCIQVGRSRAYRRQKNEGKQMSAFHWEYDCNRLCVEFSISPNQSDDDRASRSLLNRVDITTGAYADLSLIISSGCTCTASPPSRSTSRSTQSIRLTASFVIRMSSGSRFRCTE